MEKEEKEIRFVARFYREDKLNTTQAWQKLGIDKGKRRYTLLYKAAAVAAVLCLIAGLGWWRTADRQDWTVIATTDGKVKEITLPDHTRITLAENSTLRYDQLAYGKESRQVELDGKAYFAVTHQEQCPFRVNTRLADIQVLGTCFQVTAGKEQTSATVESGKVCFRNRAQEEAILTRGMSASANATGKMEVETENNRNTFAWKTRVFVYNETRLKDVVRELEEVFNVHIGNLPREEHYLTASFDRTPIEEIIDVINQTLDTKLVLTK